MSLNERAADRDRERQSAAALRHLGEEIAELIDLRGGRERHGGLG